jgi:hypothetical protein
LSFCRGQVTGVRIQPNPSRRLAVETNGGVAGVGATRNPGLRELRGFPSVQPQPPDRHLRQPPSRGSTVFDPEAQTRRELVAGRRGEGIRVWPAHVFRSTDIPVCAASAHSTSSRSATAKTVHSSVVLLHTSSRSSKAHHSIGSNIESPLLSPLSPISRRKFVRPWHLAANSSTSPHDSSHSSQTSHENSSRFMSQSD